MREAARRALLAWRDLLPGGLLLLAGLGLAALTFGVTRWTALGLAAAGLALLWAGWQRRRWERGTGTGPGIVRVDERRLAYMGPLAGGLIELDELRRLDFRPGQQGGTWLLSGPAGQRLDVPDGALGAEALLDAFAGLPGLSVERLLAARGAEGPVTVWRRDAHLTVVR